MHLKVIENLAEIACEERLPHHQGSANHNSMLPNVVPSLCDDSVLPGVNCTPLNQKNTLFYRETSVQLSQRSVVRHQWCRPMYSLVNRGMNYSWT